MCGDFNCSSTSKLYEFITQSKLKNFKTLNRNQLSGQFCGLNGSFKQIESKILPDHIGISNQSQFKEEVDKRISQVLSDNQNESESSPQVYCSFDGSHLRHTFNFKSVYKHYNENNELEVTSIINNEPKKTVDYIFFHSESNQIGKNDIVENNNNNINHLIDSSSKIKRTAELVELEENASNAKNELELIASLELFTVNQLEHVRLPNEHFPSDHFLLAAKFTLN